MKSMFAGVRVVDFTNNYAGPLLTSYLADFGAEVIKIEKPRSGDDSRLFNPLLDGVGVPYMWINRGKKSVVLDLDDPDGREIALKLVATADIVTENFRPGTMTKLGLGYESLKKINPSLIMCSISAFGQTGPYSKKSGYDVVTQALSGIMDMTGEADGPPTRVGFVVADYNAGVHGFAAVSAALYHRRCTGVGQYLDISMLDCLVSYNSFVEIGGLGKKTARSGNHHMYLIPFGLFKGTGGSIVIGAVNQKLWVALCDVMGGSELADNPMFVTAAARLKNRSEVIVAIETWLQSFSAIEQPLALLEQGGIPCAKVNSTDDVLEDAQLKARGMIAELETPDGISVRKIRARGNPFKFSECPAVLKKAPALGQHQQEVLRAIGYDEIAIARLKYKWS